MQNDLALLVRVKSYLLGIWELGPCSWGPCGPLIGEAVFAWTKRSDDPVLHCCCWSSLSRSSNCDCSVVHTRLGERIRVGLLLLWQNCTVGSSILQVVSVFDSAQLASWGSFSLCCRAFLILLYFAIWQFVLKNYGQNGLLALIFEIFSNRTLFRKLLGKYHFFGPYSGVFLQNFFISPITG